MIGGCIRLMSVIVSTGLQNIGDAVEFSVNLGVRWLRTRKPLAYRESTCTNLSVSCPYEIIVYSVLKHINTARMHTISRQFIPLIYRSLGKRIFLKSNLFCPFTSVKSCPLVILPVLILKKYIRVYIFMIIQNLKNFYLIPPQSSRLQCC